MNGEISLYHQILSVTMTVTVIQVMITNRDDENDDKSHENIISTYLIPIKICAPLIFAHLARAKIKGSKFAQ